jgi:Mg2+/Co2+ transporter CorB
MPINVIIFHFRFASICGKIKKNVNKLGGKAVRVFWTFFWTFLLINMVTYVVSSMQGIEYHFATGSTLAIAATVLILVIAQLIPNEPIEH